MYPGVVKNFDVKLGFGYITMDKNQTDVFVHATAFFAGCFEAAARFVTAAVQDQAPHPNRKKSKQRDIKKAVKNIVKEEIK